MAVITFPSSPSTNQTYTVGSKTWIYNGYAWDLQLANAAVIFAQANAAFDKANSANVLAQSAYNTANTANSTDYTTISTTAGVYGNATYVPVTTLAANGRVSSITNTAISFPVTSVAGVTGAVSNTSLLNGIKAVDGAGSGLDADLLDGQHASYYIDTSATAQTKLGGSNALLVGGLSNTYYVQASASAYSAMPMGSEIWHDVFAFCKQYTTTYETYDGSTWSSATLNKNLFAQKENQSIQVADGTSITAARWTFTDVSWSSAPWVVIGHAWSSGTSNKTVLVETSADGVTWTTRHTSTYTNNACAIFHYLDSYSGDAYMRITITRNPSSTATINLSAIRLMTARPGDQGRGKELEFPYTWDADQNITTGNTLYVKSTANTVWHAGNDGAGSGLDADTLDGFHYTAFANATFANTDYTTISTTAGVYANATYVPVITLAANGRVSSITNTAISFPVTSVGSVTGAVSNTQLLSSILTVDGTGSGLDADLLDGQHASYYATDTKAQAAFDKANTAITTSGGTISGSLVVTGNLSVQGDTTYIDVGTIKVEDKNIELGNVATPTDTTADGGGITLLGSTNKTFQWVNATGYWTSNVGISAPTVISTVATGTAPLTVTSTTMVTNLNADYLDGQHGSYYATDTKAQAAFDTANSAATTANTDYTNISITAGTYGNSSAIPQVTVAANGRVTAITTQTFSAATVGDILALSIALG